MPPSPASGRVASRVHNTTPAGVGSPDATPKLNSRSGVSAPARPKPRRAGAAAAAPMIVPGEHYTSLPLIKYRRVSLPVYRCMSRVGDTVMTVAAVHWLYCRLS